MSLLILDSDVAVFVVKSFQCKYGYIRDENYSCKDAYCKIPRHLYTLSLKPQGCRWRKQCRWRAGRPVTVGVVEVGVVDS